MSLSRKFCPYLHYVPLLISWRTHAVEINYFTVGECVRILFTSCDGSLINANPDADKSNANSDDQALVIRFITHIR